MPQQFQIITGAKSPCDAIYRSWADLARRSMRYSLIAASEADVERIIGEHHEIQGNHGVKFGTETPDARLVSWHQHEPWLKLKMNSSL
jgi:hypothetical protein